MPSGIRLTEQQVDAILAWAEQELRNGRQIPRAMPIAKRLGITRQAVLSAAWMAAASWGKHTRWKDSDDLS